MASVQAQVESSAGTSNSSRPAPPSDDVGDFYIYQGERVPLHRSETALGVRFRSTGRQNAAASLRAVIPEAILDYAGDPGTRGVSIVILPPASSEDSNRRQPASRQMLLAQARNALSASTSVDFVFPVFINPVSGIRILVTDEVVARLRAGVPASAIVERFPVTPVGPLWNTTDEYVFRLADPKSTDPFEIANAMTGSGLVRWAEPNFIQEYQRPATPDDTLFPSQWHLENTGQGGGTPGADAHLPGAWDLTTGSADTVIAIIDDGVERTHEDLAANAFTNPGEIPANGVDDDGNGYIDDVNGWDFSNNDNDPSPMSTDDNHGTAVAGVAAGRGDNGIGVSGACQGCSILPVKIFSPSFAGDTAAANAIRYAASFADVLNNSWGGGAPSSTIQSAIQWATTNGRGGKGSVVLFASGNSAGAFVTFTLTDVPAGTHGFRWRYAKDSSLSQGDDTAWLAWVEFPGGERVDFESGMPAGWTTGGNSPWSVVTDRNHADEGFCEISSAKAGTITDSQSTYLAVVRTVPAGSLRFRAWVSSEATYDRFWLDFSPGNTGSWSPYFGASGVPAITTDVSYPAAHPESIAVGAVTDFGCRANYSQYGSALAFVAPSNGGNSGITTTDRTGSAGYDTAANYTSSFGGTSSATPLSSGIAGLLLSRDPGLTVAQVRQVFQDTADKVGPDPYVSGRNDRYGYGRINAATALAAVTPCSYSIDPTTASAAAGGGNGSVTVTASPGCDWTAVNNDAWITVTGGASGSGNGTVSYSVDASTGPARTGTITIGGQTFTVNQASGCTWVIDPTSASVAAGGGGGSVSVTAGPGCGWTAVSNDAWITVTGGASGSGSGSVDYSVAVNTGPVRSGTVTIGGESFTVNQASGCSWALDPTSVSVGTGGGSGGVNVTAGAGCGWTAVSNDGWITVTGGASGSGNGTVGYTVAANAGQARSGTIAIADQTFSIDQAGNAFTDIGASLTGVVTGSIAWGDYDNDGDLDILLAGDGFGAVAKVYRNDGGGVFTDIGAGLTGVYQAAAAWGDYDNDGDLDILLAGSNSGGNPVTMVYRNDGGGSFTDIGAALVGIYMGSVAWGDYDNDGDLDILLAGGSNSGLVSKVYRNDGGGVFTDISAALVGVYDKGAVAWGDYDNDGDLDILLAGDSNGTRNAKVYRNDGGGVFTDIAAALTPVSSCSVAWGDYDNDGDLDILLTGATGSAYVAKLYRNDGGGAFTDTGAALSGVYSGSVAWGDYDNDGDPDILLAGYSNSAVPVSIVYRNDGGGVFTDIGASLTGVFWGSVTTWGDYDNDGRLDILLAGFNGSVFVTKLYRGGGPTPNTAPDAPTDLVAVAGPGQVTLGWTASSDAQTPAAGLTYNVHVGNTAGGIQIVSPMASLGRATAASCNGGMRASARRP